MSLNWPLLSAVEPTVQRTDLEGGCFVTHLDALQYQLRDTCAWSTYISRALGSTALSMTAMRFATGTAPAIGFPGRDQVLYAVSGAADLRIGARQFKLRAGTGAYLFPEEQFTITNEAAGPLTLLVGVCPESTDIRFDSGSAYFNEEQPERLVHADRQAMEATGDRYYKLLVGRSVGCLDTTQFIGMIPRSKAPAHFHTYEETLCILSGEGFMWTGSQKAAVGPGSLIYLPRKQSHSLECISPEGMSLVGLFHPAGSPAVRYDDE